jgi:hypothetical protein
MALVLSICCAVCADDEIARNGSIATANSVRIVSMVCLLENVGLQRSAISLLSRRAGLTIIRKALSVLRLVPTPHEGKNGNNYMLK